MTSLQVTNLEVKIGDRVILSDLNLEVASGKFAAILGPSGCGKTTLLRAIAGLITPSAGAIRFGNKLVSVSSLVLPPHKRNVGYVPQEGGLFPHLRVAENVAFALKGKVERTEREEIVSQMLALVGLSTFAKRFPHELSGGQQTRVALARALAIKPALVLLDEPFSALDQALRGEISGEVVALLKESKTTALMVTHDREDALVSADVIAVMRKGSVVQYGSPAEIYLNPISADVAESTGDVVTIPAHKVSNSEVISPLHNAGAIRAQVDLEGLMLIRPEEILISRVEDSKGVRAKITKINYYGHDALIDLIIEGVSTPVRARVAGPESYVVGENVFAHYEGPIRYFVGP
ncbi:MAG: ABC transporter ATP-binding protein [Candidatus Nanopelagicaceae bacterium]